MVPVTRPWNAAIAPSWPRPGREGRRPAVARTGGGGPLRRLAALRPVALFGLELRRSAMLWMLPVSVALFWFIAYRKVSALPPFWDLRARTMQSDGLLDFVLPVVAAAAWTGSREGRHHMADLVSRYRSIPGRPPARRLGRHGRLGRGGLCGLRRHPVRRNSSTGELGWPSVVAGGGRHRRRAGVVGRWLRRRGRC